MTNKEIEKGCCGWCGFIVNKKDEGENGIVCPKCHNDFWFSEALPLDWKKQGYILINEQLGRGAIK